MIISNDQELTEQVLAVMRRTTDPRLREILESLVAHLHQFVRDVRLTEDEFRAGTALFARLGQLTTPTHNEVVLLAGSLGIAPLVVLLNNGQGGRGNSASMLGPFWRKRAPRTANGGSLLRSETPGPRFMFTGHVVDRQGSPVVGADVDVWHSSTVGLYENQDPSQADMNLRGIFTTDETGSFSFTSVKPAGYPIPHEGNVVGELLQAQGRHCFRPAHVHIMVVKPGFKTLVSQIYMPDDPHIEDDVQFGVRRELIADLRRHDEPAPGHPDWTPPWYSVEHTLYLDAGVSKVPLAPIE